MGLLHQYLAGGFPSAPKGIYCVCLGIFIAPLRAAEQKTILTPMFYAIHPLSESENRHIQFHLLPEIHAALLSGTPAAITYGQIPAKGAGLSGALVLVVTSATPSRFAITKRVELVGTDLRESKPERWEGRDDGVAVAKSNHGFPTFQEESRECIGNIVAKVEFKCLLAATISRFEFESDGKRKEVVKEGLKAKAQGYTRFS